MNRKSAEERLKGKKIISGRKSTILVWLKTNSSKDPEINEISKIHEGKREIIDPTDSQKK